MKLGILGGTFDPIHNGHLAAAEAAILCAELDRVLFVPSAQPPHRPPAVASAQQRLEMCRRALDGDDRFEASDVEVARGGPSYTVDTLRALHETAGPPDLYLILGWDAAKLFNTWHEPDAVLTLAKVVVIGRPGLAAPSVGDLDAVGLDASAVILCRRSTPDIAARDLRAAVAQGRSIAGLVPDAVLQYISAHGLYAG